MAKTTPLLFLLAALLCHLHTGESQAAGCGKADIKFTVMTTGLVVGGQPEYEVQVETPCPCPMKGVRVWCGGIENSAEPVDASKVEVHDGMCVFKQDISKTSQLFFKYSSEVPVDFRVFNAVPSC